jgi:hypothetical protein
MLNSKLKYKYKRMIKFYKNSNHYKIIIKMRLHQRILNNYHFLIKLAQFNYFKKMINNLKSLILMI